jgi:hypothetical protein
MEQMMASDGPMIWGFSTGVFIMFASGIFYLLCAIMLWKPLRRDRTELGLALFAFLVYQAISMFFMGLEMETMNMLYGEISTLAVLIGSVYMLKFPLSGFSASTRKIAFYLSLIVVIGIFIWFMQSEETKMMMMKFTLWYDIIINGIVVGGSIFAFAFKVPQKWLRVKAIGGGSGVVSCCVVSNATMLSGAILTSAFFAFLAPVLILGTLLATRSRS